MDNSQILQKIKQLLALSESNNENEALAAYSAAQKLMTKYRISLSELQEQQKPQFAIGKAFFKSHNTSLWKERLAGVLTKLNGCYWYREEGYTDSGSREIKFILVGVPETMELVDYLFNSIINQTEVLCKKKMPKGGGKAWANTFKHGVTLTVQDRLEQAKKDAVKEVVLDNMVGELPTSVENTSQYSTALVRLDNQYEDVRQWLNSQIKLKTIKHVHKTAYVPGALNAGREAGKEINLSRPLKR